MHFFDTLCSPLWNRPQPGLVVEMVTVFSGVETFLRFKGLLGSELSAFGSANPRIKVNNPAAS